MEPSAPTMTPTRPPGGPFAPGFWRSPLRGPRLTAILGLVLLVGLPVVIVTGLLSNVAYEPALGGNSLGRSLSGPLDIYLFDWPVHPAWLYAVTQGLHVAVGLALFPVLLAKLWSVIPRLFEWPPVRDPAHALERASLALLVGGALFEFVTGTLNIQYWDVFGFDFVQAHYYGAWVFIGAFGVHVTLKLPTMRRALRTRAEVMDAPATGETSLSPLSPAAPTMSRRALLTGVGGASVVLGLQGLGQSAGGPLRALAFLVPRGRTRPGPLGFPVNKTWASSGLTDGAIGDGWRLTLTGRRTVALTRDQLLAMDQYTHDLPIACVEGWSTTQRWSGVRLSDLAAVCGVRGPATVSSVSLERGTYGHATLGSEQVADPRALLALRVNGADLSPDHGHPARVIAPGIPGVHCTKWVTEMRFDHVSA